MNAVLNVSQVTGHLPSGAGVVLRTVRIGVLSSSELLLSSVLRSPEKVLRKFGHEEGKHSYLSRWSLAKSLLLRRRRIWQARLRFLGSD
jgi:hypothetical protein